MTIVNIDDDAQNGVDHVDAHRSLLMVVLPWSRRNGIGQKLKGIKKETSIYFSQRPPRT